MFSKTFLILVSIASLALATPIVTKRNTATCDFIATPTPDSGVEGLQTSINYAVGHTVAVEYTGKAINGEHSLVRHNDGTYDVHSTIEVEGVDAAEVGAFVESLDDATLDGLYAEWKVNAVNCY